ncbi:hypothetical protein Hanom_Chr02g00176371 [Helianthus anomalus]
MKTTKDFGNVPSSTTEASLLSLTEVSDESLSVTVSALTSATRLRSLTTFCSVTSPFEHVSDLCALTSSFSVKTESGSSTMFSCVCFSNSGAPRSSFSVETESGFSTTCSFDCFSKWGPPRSSFSVKTVSVSFTNSGVQISFSVETESGFATNSSVCLCSIDRFSKWGPPRSSFSIKTATGSFTAS